MSIYDRMVDTFHSAIEKKKEDGNATGSEAANVKRGKRPLKMPKNYDFSVRNVDWSEYKNDFLLRTDAIWEKSKMYDLFYAHYKKNVVFDKTNNRYMVTDIRMMPMPTNEPEHNEEWQAFQGYSPRDGVVWQFRYGPKVQTPTNLSQFVSDKEGDSWYLCFLGFQKFMICNERSPVKLEEVNLFNKGFWDYPCYDEVEAMFEHCGPDLFEPLFEAYRVRLMSGVSKPQGFSRVHQGFNAYGTLSDRKVLHY